MSWVGGGGGGVMGAYLGGGAVTGKVAGLVALVADLGTAIPGVAVASEGSSTEGRGGGGGGLLSGGAVPGHVANTAAVVALAGGRPAAGKGASAKGSVSGGKVAVPGNVAALAALVALRAGGGGSGYLYIRKGAKKGEGTLSQKGKKEKEKGKKGAYTREWGSSWRYVQSCRTGSTRAGCREWSSHGPEREREREQKERRKKRKELEELGKLATTRAPIEKNLKKKGDLQGVRPGCTCGKPSQPWDSDNHGQRGQTAGSCSRWRPWCSHGQGDRL